MRVIFVRTAAYEIPQIEYEIKPNYGSMLMEKFAPSILAHGYIQMQFGPKIHLSGTHVVKNNATVSIIHISAVLLV